MDVAISTTPIAFEVRESGVYSAARALELRVSIL
jgi:hypothetical protein